MRLFKIVCPFLCMLVLCGCKKTTIEESMSVNQEIGETAQTLAVEDTYVKSIQYPITSITTLDEQIQNKVHFYEDAFMAAVDSDTYDITPQLNITYESYMKNERYISIILHVYKETDKVEEYVETLVYDLKKEDWVQFQDILRNDALTFLSTQASVYFKERYPAQCNTDNFRSHISAAQENYQNFIMRKDAILFYFPKGSLFDQEVSFTISYADLKDYTSLENEATKAYVPYDDILNEPTKHINGDKPMVALTFDDGPSVRYTSVILDALKEYNASATFFVLGSNAQKAPDVLQRMVLEGNEIGNHTYSHKQLTTLSKENIEEEIIATQESIYGITHKYPTIVRPPYGSKNDTVLECAKDKKVVTWTLDTSDWKRKDSKAIVEYVCENVKDGDIILMHDLYATSAQAATLLIPRLQEMGYQLVTVSELYTYQTQ